MTKGAEDISDLSHQHARADRPAAAADCLASVAGAGGVDVAVAPVQVEAAAFPLELVVSADGWAVLCLPFRLGGGTGGHFCGR